MKLISIVDRTAA